MSFSPSRTRITLVLYCLAALAVGTLASPAQTLAEINKANGFYESLVAIGPNFANGIKSIPVPLSKKFQDAWSDAMQGSFDADKMEAAIESRMADKLTAADLFDLATFYASPLGKRVTALEIQASALQAKEEKATEGSRILAELPSSDPARLELYRRIMDDLSAVDMGEAIALNVGYAMAAGMLGAVGQPLKDEQITALVHQQSANIREEIEKKIMEGNVYTYRDLSIDDLKLYSAFLASPAGSRYYDQMLTAFGMVVGDEARSFGQRLFVTLGYRKA
jgi:hypothetical protein